MFGSAFRARIVLFLVVLVLLAALTAQTQAQPIGDIPVTPVTSDDGPNLVTNEGAPPPSSGSLPSPVMSSEYPPSNEGAPLPVSEASPFTSAYASSPASDKGALPLGNGLMKNPVTNEIIAP